MNVVMVKYNGILIINEIINNNGIGLKFESIILINI